MTRTVRETHSNTHAACSAHKTPHARRTHRRETRTHTHTHTHTYTHTRTHTHTHTHIRTHAHVHNTHAHARTRKERRAGARKHAHAWRMPSAVISCNIDAHPLVEFPRASSGNTNARNTCRCRCAHPIRATILCVPRGRGASTHDSPQSFLNIVSASARVSSSNGLSTRESSRAHPMQTNNNKHGARIATNGPRCAQERTTTNGDRLRKRTRKV